MRGRDSTTELLLLLLILPPTFPLVENLIIYMQLNIEILFLESDVFSFIKQLSRLLAKKGPRSSKINLPGSGFPISIKPCNMSLYHVLPKRRINTFTVALEYPTRC